MARSTNGKNPFVARRLLGPSSLPHIEFTFQSRCSLSKQYEVFCVSLQCLCVVSFSVTSCGSGMSCISRSGCVRPWQGERCWCLKLCVPRFTAVAKAFFHVASYWLGCWHVATPLRAVLSPLSLLSSGISIANLSPNLLYMWWRNKIS